VKTALSQHTRRSFLKASAGATGGLVVAFTVPLGGNRFAFAAESAADGAAAKALPKLPAPNVFLRVGTDDQITVLLSQTESGQGVWTTLPMLIAEELDADWTKIRVQHAPNDPAYNHLIWGYQVTGGSTSTWSEFDRYRQAGAVARTLLVEAAAKRGGLRADECRTENGMVIAGTKRWHYGELAAVAAKLAAPTTVTLKEPSEWKIIGQSPKRLDSPQKTNGQAVYGLDVHFDGLMTALLIRCPVPGATIESVNSAACRAVPGVRDVVQVPSGVAVIADHFWAAKRGRDALEVHWNLGAAGKQLDSEALVNLFRSELEKPGAIAASAGDINSGMAEATKTIDAEFKFPYLAHATMEPLNYAVRISADKCEMWTGTQGPGIDAFIASQITGLQPNQIVIHNQFLGGSFGHRTDFDSHTAAEAVQVAKAAGRPVKTVWTREDDTRGGYYRPAYLHRVHIGIDSKGRPVAWQHSIVGQSILSSSAILAKMFIKNGVDATSVEGTADSPYLKNIPHHRIELHSPQLPIKTNPWRSVGNSHNAFVMETLIDELAQIAGKDPVVYRRELLDGAPRHLAALNLAAEKAKWGSPLAPGRARGVAVHAAFGSFVAQVAEVSIENNTIRVHRVVCAIDCGLAVNPDGVKAQMESGIVFGLSAALYGSLTLKNGVVVQSNFHDYRLLRLNEMPRVEAYIVPSTERMGGVGEPGVPPIAPAVANAVAVLTGKRLRELPLKLSA
jgi:isoquinoline 1-oxidoreductase subunit beta